MPVERRWRGTECARGCLSLALGLLVAAFGFEPTAASPAHVGPLSSIQTVFVILMENTNWAGITPATAPYIRNTLLPMGAHAEQYFNPPGLHPSQPNYIWLEAGHHLGLVTNANPSVTYSSPTPDHLVRYLEAAGVSWKTYQEDISGIDCPLIGAAGYVPRHNPFVYFQDVTDGNNPYSPTCIAHVRPYTELASDLAANRVARYNFITPNLCHDMHDCGVTAGDTWLSQQLPTVLASQAYQNNGAIFLTWDEGAPGDGPIGMVVLSPLAKVNYSNSVHYTHSSTLRTMQAIFGVGPFLRDAANAVDLSDLFAQPATARLNLQKAGSGTGLVTSTTGLSCGGVCSQSYNSGRIVTLTATPDAGSTFAGWSGSSCAGTQCTITLTGDASITATFLAPPGQVGLDVSVRGSGQGSIDSSPPGISCPASCRHLFAADSLVALTAGTALASFKGWSGAGCSGTGTCIVQMSARQSVSAIFSAVFTYPDPAPGASPVRAADLIELRSAIDSLRVKNAGLAPFLFADPTVTAGLTSVRSAHLAELRLALGEAYVQAGVTPPPYTDVMLPGGAVVIKAGHITELRSAVRALE